MEAENLNPLVISSYDYGFRRDAHQLLAWGYENAIPKIHCKLQEEEITGFIAEEIEDKLDDPYLPERFERYSISDEKPISGEGRTGKSRRRLDLVIVSGHNRPRPKYIFEAKRLCRNSYPISKYIGKDGLKCYVNGIYASQYPEAAMIGYIQSDSSQYWENQLRRSFDKDSNNSLCLEQKLQETKVIDSLLDEWVSQHHRHDQILITVYHIFLDCCALPPIEA